MQDHETSDHRISTCVRYGSASYLDMALEQCGFYSCIVAWPSTGLHQGYSSWKIQSEAAEVAPMAKMGFQRDTLCSLLSIWSILLHCGVPRSPWDVVTSIPSPLALWERWHASCGSHPYKALDMQLVGPGRLTSLVGLLLLASCI